MSVLEKTGGSMSILIKTGGSTNVLYKKQVAMRAQTDN
jgi:hypothetical protein